jgi:hypothetical protein
MLWICRLVVCFHLFSFTHIIITSTLQRWVDVNVVFARRTNVQSIFGPEARKDLLRLQRRRDGDGSRLCAVRGQRERDVSDGSGKF